MVTHFLGDICKKVVVHNDTDADKKTHIEAVAFKNLVNAATFHVNGAREPGNTSALGFEFLFNHVAEMNCLLVHNVSKFENRHKNSSFYNNTNNFLKIFLKK